MVKCFLIAINHDGPFYPENERTSAAIRCSRGFLCLWILAPVLPLAYAGAKRVRYAARGSKKLMKGFCHPPKGASILRIPA